MAVKTMTSQELQHNSPPGDSAEPESHRVLIVDDEPAICFAYKRLLEREQFGFDICESVETATILLKRTDYFAVISDVRFAGVGNEDGIYLASVVRNEHPQSEVILVTGYGCNELKMIVHELGVSHYFEKPVKPAVILSLLRTLHRSAHERAEVASGSVQS